MLTRKEYETHTKPTDCLAKQPPIFQDFSNRQRYAVYSPPRFENKRATVKSPNLCARIEVFLNANESLEVSLVWCFGSNWRYEENTFFIL